MLPRFPIDIMFSSLYVEEEVANHPRVAEILSRYSDLPVVRIKRYGEIFNRKEQNFRLQKNKPALILAKKHQKQVMQAPANYGLGGEHNYYFSHMLNCIYDCRYCFLQGMYQSAHYLLFVNYEDFETEIEKTLSIVDGEPCYFYSGYDCDSLALEPVTKFIENFLPYFSKHKNAIVEIRTKSTQIRSLLEHQPLDNCIVAFSFTPAAISEALEHKVPTIQKRVDAINKLQDRGWNIGLRFDPIIYDDRYQEQYAELFELLFSQIDPGRLHSVSLGVFRLPEPFYRKMQRLYPEEKLFAARLEKQNGMVSYGETLEQKMLHDCETLLMNYIPNDIYFPCKI